MNGPLSRRRLLGGALAGTATLAGCLRQTPRRTSRVLLVTNATTEFFTVTVRLYALPEDADATEAASTTASPTERERTATATGADRDPPTNELEQVFVRRKDLSPEAGFGVGGDRLPDGDLRVQITTTNGQSDSYDWSRLDERSTLDVRIFANAVRFTEVD